MSTLQLKRNISTEAEKDPPKRPKLRKPLDTRYVTPNPSALSLESVYKLPSSIGPTESPSNFSPIPKATAYRRAHRRTSSTNLKENANILQTTSPFPRPKPRQNRIKKYGKAARKRSLPLESPFNSCSSSASSASSPDSSQNKLTSTDTKYDPHAARLASYSTASSPAQPVASPVKARRPSVPTPPRIANWNYISSVSAVDLHASIASDSDPRLDADLPPDTFQPVIRPSPNHSQLDFNRPPSQLSLYDYNSSIIYDDKMDVDDADLGQEDRFFSDVRYTSTPFKHPGSFGFSEDRFRGSADSAGLLESTARYSDTDSDADESDDDMLVRLLQRVSKNKSKNRSGYITPAEDSGGEEIRPRSPWINDSLISPPKTVDWQLPRKLESGAYKQANVVDPGDNIVTDEEKRIPEHILEGLFDNLIIMQSDEAHSSPSNDECIRLPPRTRSLDTALASAAAAPTPVPSEAPGARRTRSGTVILESSSNSTATISTTIPVPPRRTRSGTVVPGNVDVFSLPLSDDQSASGPVPPAPALGRRTRSGTVIPSASSLAPSLPIVEEGKTGGAISPSDIPMIARRARSSSIMAPSSMPECTTANSVAGSTTGMASRSRIRSGSIVAQVGNTLSQAAGIMKRARSGTVVHAPPTIASAVERAADQSHTPVDCASPPRNEDIEIPLASESKGTADDFKLASSTRKCPQNLPEDTIDLLDEPMVFSRPKDDSSPLHSVTDGNTVFNARSSNGLRARAKAAASKAKGISKALTGKGGARGKGVLTGAEAGAAALARARARAERKSEQGGVRDHNGEDSSDDELLLK